MGLRLLAKRVAIEEGKVLAGEAKAMGSLTEAEMANATDQSHIEMSELFGNLPNEIHNLRI